MSKETEKLVALQEQLKKLEEKEKQLRKDINNYSYALEHKKAIK